MKVNEGMLADYRMATIRSERAAVLAYGGGGSLFLNIILWWPFDQYMWLMEAVLFALIVAFAFTAVDYRRKAKEIERAWRDAYHLPG